MTSPNRSVIVRLAMEPTSYIAGASRAAAATTALDREVAKVGATSATSMERAAAGAGRTEGAFGRLNKATSVLGVNFGTLAAAGGAVAVALSIKSAGDFQQSLTKLATTAGESTKNLHMVGDGMLTMAGQVGISANELAKGMYTVESSGIHGANALTVLKAAAQGAKQENADLGKVTDAVTTALHDYNLPASDAAKVTSQLVTAVSHGKTTFDELTGAMHSVTPLAAALHVPLADIAGTLSAMTASGESADQAAQNMADALRHMQNPTSTMTAELAQLGITSTELGPMLGEKGLAGTIQTISGAILKQMGPAGTVMLDALNKSKVASDDLQIMLKQMPPSLAKLSQGFLEGSVGISDYRKGVNDLGGQAGAMGTQFLSLVKTSQGFNGMLKSGQPDVQTYTAALQKAMGTSAGLTVALQVTGEHAAATNVAIKDIAGASAQADKSIKGWSEVQGNFNQQLSQAEYSIGAMAIRLGQSLLPGLTAAFGYINRDVVPGLEHLGSGLGNTAHWFTQLPAPIKEVAVALGALALSNAVGLTGLLSTGATKLGASFAAAGAGVGSFNVRVAEQQMLMATQARNMTLDAAATGTFAERLAALTLAEDAAAAAGGRLSATMVVAGRSIGAGAMSAGSKFVNMLGGPWMLATAGAVIGVMALMDAVKRHDEQIKAATVDVQRWDQAVALGAGGQTAMQAQQNLDALRGKLAAVTAQIDKYNAAAQQGYARGGIGTLVSQQQELRSELDKGAKAWDAQLVSMTPVQIAQGRVQQATHDLNMALKDNPPNSDAVVNASRRLSDAQSALTYQTNLASDATKTQLERLQDLANKQLGAVNSGLAAQQSQLQFLDAMAQLNAGMADGSLKGNALAEAQNSLAQSAISAAQAAGQNAADQAKANGVTDTAQASNAAMLKSLQDNEQFIVGPAKAAYDKQIQILQNATVQTGSLTDAISKMGLTNVTESDSFRSEWGTNVQVLSGATAAQIKDLQGLGYTVMTLPNHQIVVSADTGAARNAITQLTNDYAQYSINVGLKVGSSSLARAAGGPIVGPGTATSDSIPVMASNGEHMWTASEVQAAGGHGAMFALRTAVLGGALHRASGGPVTLDDMYLKARVGINPASIAAAGQTIRSAASAAAASSSAPGAPTSVQGNAAIVQQMAAARGWTGAEWNALYALVMRESGFRNTAQNPTSTAYGMFQFLNSTWGAYGGGKTSDPTAQTRMGLDYIASKYRDPIGAWGHETKFGWYDNGGPLLPGLTMALNTTGKTETIRTADQEASMQRMLRTREMAGSSRGGGSSIGVASRTVQGMVFNGPVEIKDTDAMLARANRHAAMAAARFR